MIIKKGVFMADNNLDLFIKKMESILRDIQLLQRQLEALGKFTGRDHLSAMVNAIEKQMQEASKAKESFIETWREIEEQKSVLEGEIASARQLQADPAAWMDEQKKKLEDQWLQLEAERTRLKNNQQEIRDAANLMQADKERRARLRKEINLWAQNMAIFVVILVVMLALSALVPVEFRTPVIISMGIFAIFPFMAVAVATYNIMRF
jgi:chromosome segregation ATPase